MVDGDTVQSVFMRLNARKAAGPDGIIMCKLLSCVLPSSLVYSANYSHGLSGRVLYLQFRKTQPSIMYQKAEIPVPSMIFDLSLLHLL